MIMSTPHDGYVISVHKMMLEYTEDCHVCLYIVFRCRKMHATITIYDGEIIGRLNN